MAPGSTPTAASTTKSAEMLGMTPSDYRAGGANAAIRFAVGDCSLGSILVASSAKGVCAILIGDDPEMLVHDLQDRFPRASLIGGDANFEQLVARVVGFIEAPAIGLDLPLDVRGTAFQQRVWAALREIPAGQDRLLHRHRQDDWCAEGRSGGGGGLGGQRFGGGDPLSPGGAERRRAFRLPLGNRTQACPD